MRPSWWCVAAIVGSASIAGADHHQLTGLTFDSPAAWKSQDVPDHSTNVLQSDKGVAIFVVYSPHPAVTGGLAAAFAADWKTATSLTPTKTVPTPAARKLGGRNVLEGSMETIAQGSPVIVDVLLLEAGSQVVPTLVYTQDRKTQKALQPDLDKMIASIAVTATDPAPAPVAAAPVATTGARVLPTITLNDIAGSWNTHDQAVTTYVDGSTGAYSGTMATSVQEWYEIKADGSYTRKFQGLSNGHVIRESGKGVIALTADAIVFTEDGKEKQRMHFIEFAIDADGNAHWKLLDAQYPTTKPNIGLYAQKWVRVVAKK
jgi:hypothetical protein